MSHLYSWWVLTLCHEIGFILLSDLCFGVSSLQYVSVDFVPWNWFSFAEWPLLWCLISTESECWLCAMNQFIFWSDIYFGVQTLQLVSVSFLCFILLSNLYKCWLEFSSILPHSHHFCVIHCCSLVLCTSSWVFLIACLILLIFSLWVCHPI